MSVLNDKETKAAPAADYVEVVEFKDSGEKIGARAREEGRQDRCGMARPIDA